MPHLSGNKLSKKIENELCDTLELVLSKLNDKDSVKTFLTSFLTPTERLMLAKRLSIIILLRQKVPQEHIAQTLNVTRVTVSRMQLYMEARGQGIEFIFKILRNTKTK